MRPVSVGLLTLLVAVLFVLVRLFTAAHGDITRFMLAGDVFTDASAVPGDVHVFSGPGNDGQFNYRLALDPTELGLEAHDGISMDLPLRAGRIGYPALAWLVSGGGRADALPVVLVALNVVALGAMGWAGARLAERSGRAPIAGLLFPAYFGFLFSLSRDYGDIVAAAAVLAAITAGAARRPIIHGLLLGFAVLTREPYLALVAGLIGERAWDAWRHRALRARRADLAWAVPLVGFVTWQVVVWRSIGSAPAFSGSDNRSLPFVGLVRALADWFHKMVDFPSDHVTAAMAALSLVQLVVFGVIVFEVVRTLQARSRPPDGVTVAWVLLLGLSVLVSADVWGAFNDFRNMSELALLSTVVIVTGRRSLNASSGAIAAGWSVTAVARAVRV
jgi:hypothetical protein